jgi:hypothetical protein
MGLFWLELRTVPLGAISGGHEHSGGFDDIHRWILLRVEFGLGDQFTVVNGEL